MQVTLKNGRTIEVVREVFTRPDESQRAIVGLGRSFVGVPGDFSGQDMDSGAERVVRVFDREDRSYRYFEVAA